MFCPRCGAESEEGDHYCASCGSDLPRTESRQSSSTEADKAGGRARLATLIGTTPRQRLITGLIVLALVVAVISFIALKPSEETIPNDAYNRALDASCVEHKEAIVAAERLAIEEHGLAGVRRYADTLVPIAAEWRADLGERSAPSDRRALVEGLEAALLEVEIKAGALARIAREGDRKAVLAASSRVDTASEGVEGAINGLELERCSRLAAVAGQLVQE